VKETDGEFIATLIPASEYAHHLNQVAGVTTKHISFLKRKFVSTSGYELVKYPMSECVGIVHIDERPLMKTVAGVLLMILMGAIFYLLVASWDELTPGMKIPVGAIFLAAIYGARWAFGARRHKIEFELRDGKKLMWKSSSGDFKYKIGCSKNVVDFAHEAGLLRPKG